MSTTLKQALFLLSSLTLATYAYASYGQMKLPGLTLFLVILLTIAYSVLVDPDKLL